MIQETDDQENPITGNHSEGGEEVIAKEGQDTYDTNTLLGLPKLVMTKVLKYLNFHDVTSFKIICRKTYEIFHTYYKSLIMKRVPREGNLLKTILVKSRLTFDAEQKPDCKIDHEIITAAQPKILCIQTNEIGGVLDGAQNVHHISINNADLLTQLAQQYFSLLMSAESLLLRVESSNDLEIINEAIKKSIMVDINNPDSGRNKAIFFQRCQGVQRFQGFLRNYKPKPYFYVADHKGSLIRDGIIPRCSFLSIQGDYLTDKFIRYVFNCLQLTYFPNLQIIKIIDHGKNYNLHIKTIAGEHETVSTRILTGKNPNTNAVCYTSSLKLNHEQLNHILEIAANTPENSTIGIIVVPLTEVDNMIKKILGDHPKIQDISIYSTIDHIPEESTVDTLTNVANSTKTLLGKYPEIEKINISFITNHKTVNDLLENLSQVQFEGKVSLHISLSEVLAQELDATTKLKIIYQHPNISVISYKQVILRGWNYNIKNFNASTLREKKNDSKHLVEQLTTNEHRQKHKDKAANIYVWYMIANLILSVVSFTGIFACIIIFPSVKSYLKEAINFMNVVKNIDGHYYYQGIEIVDYQEIVAFFKPILDGTLNKYTMVALLIAIGLTFIFTATAIIFYCLYKERRSDKYIDNAATLEIIQEIEKLNKKSVSTTQTVETVEQSEEVVVS